MSSVIKNLQDEYARTIDFANQKIKQAEMTVNYQDNDGQVNGLPIPAINELRNSAYHIARAFTQTEESEIIESYKKAINHGKRAAFDAIAIIVDYYFAECTRFQNDYSLVVINNVPANYQDDCRYIHSMKNNFPSKEQFQPDDYDYFFSQVEGFIRKLREIYTKWDVARPELNKMQRNAEWVRVGIVATVVTATFSVLGFFGNLIWRFFVNN